MMLRMSHLESEAICEDCGERATGLDSRDWAVDHVRETGHLVKLRSLMEIAPDRPGGTQWLAVATLAADKRLYRREPQRVEQPSGSAATAPSGAARLTSRATMPAYSPRGLLRPRRGSARRWNEEARLSAGLESG
jgi:hypothetical protein